MKKQELREIYKQKRKELTEKELNSLQENIYQQVFKIDYSTAKNIHIFLSMDKFIEVNTKPIINFFRNNNKNIITSCCNFTNNSLSHFLLEEDTLLQLNRFGVPEPIVAKEVSEKDIDIVFVPMLISDEQHYRVGYGKGFYDRFLSKCKKEAKLIGLNFFKPIKKIEDINKFDVALTQTIYPL